MRKCLWCADRPVYGEYLKCYDCMDEASREASLLKQAENRARVFDHYGHSCACCGSLEKPSIDHVNGDGKKHRLAIATGSVNMYRWLVNNDFPPGFQTLCVPCNSSKGTGLRCRLHPQLVP